MSLAGKYLLVTAGPTIEPLDPVRFLSNHSTGKMGYAIAGELATRGARVALISGRTNLAAPAGVERIDVLSAEEMYRAVMERFPQADGAVMCAAVADYTPAQVSTTKLKKGEGDLVIRLKRTKDIAAEAGRTKGGRLLVGFALETDHERDNALDKMRRKHFDFIVLNSLRDPGAGFAGDTNKITLMDAQGGIDEYPLETKSAAAVRIADRIERWFSDRPATR
jgi:phosphopantothenoylcysteine decarboxylase/phosphopantothenate--cysteine ligase